MRLKILLFTCTAILAVSCATTEPTTEDEDEPDLYDTSVDLSKEYDDESLSNIDLILLRTRSSLSNHYSENMVHIPDLYMQEIVVDERQRDPYAGYRVQLISTRNVAEADSIRDNFVAWADSIIAGYESDAYVVFRSPNYRVRAGDFQDRQKAIHFSGMLKSKYPDAWVVHERIEPGKVPADTTDIRFKDLEPVQFEEEMRMMESTDTTSNN